MDKDKTRGQLWTPIIPGDQIVIELYVPFGVLRKPVVVIEKIHYGYRGFDGNTPRGRCNIDVVCPEAAPWWNQIRSAALYTLSGEFQCSGVLLNNTRGDFTPYFLSACHCSVDCLNAHTMVVYWNYQSSKCCICCDRGLGGNLKDHQSGAFFRAKWVKGDDRGSDFVLVELKEKPHPFFNVYYSGWDASGEMSDPKSLLGVGIHHPRSSLKAIGLGHVFNGKQEGKEYEDYWAVKWTRGTVQNGSSGSGLWDEFSGLCIGQLRGPPIDCDDEDQDPCVPTDNACYYGKLSASWEGGGTPDTQLKYWLDPCDTFEHTGKPRRLKGDDPACDDEISLKQVSVGNEEAIWGVRKDDQILRWNGVKWESLPCCQKLKQISVGFDGTVWGVNNKAQVYRWNDMCWESIPTGTIELKQVSAACKGTVWGLDKNNQLYQWAGNTWEPIQSCPLKQVSMGGDGTAWGVDENDQIRRWMGDCFGDPQSSYPEKMKYISTACWKCVWCVDEKDSVFNYDGTCFRPVDGFLKIKQVSVGFEEVVLGLDEHGSVHRWNHEEKRWEKFK